MNNRLSISRNFVVVCGSSEIFYSKMLIRSSGELVQTQPFVSDELGVYGIWALQPILWTDV